jgi:hypothetical protein
MRPEVDAHPGSTALGDKWIRLRTSVLCRHRWPFEGEASRPDRRRWLGELGRVAALR